MNSKNVFDLINDNINEIKLSKTEVSNINNVTDLILQILQLKRNFNTLMLTIEHYRHEYNYYIQNMQNNLETIYLILVHQNVLTISLKTTTITILDELLFRLNELKNKITVKG